MKTYLITIFINLCVWLPINAQIVDFFKEDLNFYLESDSFKVQGIYFFVNQSQNEYCGRLWYPLPDSNISKVEVFNDSFDKINCYLQKKLNWGVFIPLRIKASDSTFVIVRYGQKIQGKSVRYILTSTRQWENPLKEAHFQLVVGSNFKNVQFSIIPQLKKKIGKQNLYEWEFKNFYPTKDFLLFWK